MQFTQNSIWQALRDPHIRSSIYVWFIIAAVCVLLANAFA
jgi:hypothetical protein